MLSGLSALLGVFLAERVSVHDKAGSCTLLLLGKLLGTACYSLRTQTVPDQVVVMEVHVERAWALSEMLLKMQEARCKFEADGMTPLSERLTTHLRPQKFLTCAPTTHWRPQPTHLRPPLPSTMP